MRTPRIALAGFLAASMLLVFSLSPADSASVGLIALVTAGLVGVAVASVLSARQHAFVHSAPEITVGARGRQHREVLVSLPEPTHPDTAGRVRSRAPGRAPTPR